MLFKTLVGLVGIFIVSASISGIANDPNAPSYFGGAVSVQYAPDRMDYHSYLAFCFLKAGTYHVSFLPHPDENSELLHPASNMRKSHFGLPENFSVVIGDNVEKIVKVADLRGIFRVTISRNGESEFHDFQH
jgi:hypothetical protein